MIKLDPDGLCEANPPIFKITATHSLDIWEPAW